MTENNNKTLAFIDPNRLNQFVQKMFLDVSTANNQSPTSMAWVIVSHDPGFVTTKFIDIFAMKSRKFSVFFEYVKTPALIFEFVNPTEEQPIGFYAITGGSLVQPQQQEAVKEEETVEEELTIETKEESNDKEK